MEVGLTGEMWGGKGGFGAGKEGFFWRAERGVFGGEKGTVLRKKSVGKRMFLG